MSPSKDIRSILVLGGTGHYGRPIVGSLLRMGRPVRVLSRNAALAGQVLGDTAEIVQGDVTSRESVTRALDGAGAVVVSISAFTPRLIRQLELIERDSILAVFEEAKTAGVSRVVYLSVYDIKEDFLSELGIRPAIADIKLEIEAALAGSSFDWTVLGAAYSMEMFFLFIRGNRMLVPGGGPPAMPTVSPLDVGEIAAQTVVRDDLAGRRIRMTGPEAMSFPKAAERISAVVGRTIRFRRIPLLPLRIASVVTRPFNPFLKHLLQVLAVRDHFPQDIAAEVPNDHRRLVSTFSYTPTTLEMETRTRIRSGRFA